MKHPLYPNVLRTPTLEEGNPLSVNVNKIDTSYPLLEPRLYDLKLEVTKEKSKNDSSKENLKVKYSTIEKARSTKRDELAPGFAFTEYIGITPTEARTENGREIAARTLSNIARDIAELGQACGFDGTPLDIIERPSILNGKTIRADVIVQVDKSGAYPDKNVIKSYEKVK